MGKSGTLSNRWRIVHTALFAVEGPQHRVGLGLGGWVVEVHTTQLKRGRILLSAAPPSVHFTWKQSVMLPNISHHTIRSSTRDISAHQVAGRKKDGHMGSSFLDKAVLAERGRILVLLILSCCCTLHYGMGQGCGVQR